MERKSAIYIARGSTPLSCYYERLLLRTILQTRMIIQKNNVILESRMIHILAHIRVRIIGGKYRPTTRADCCTDNLVSHKLEFDLQFLVHTRYTTMY